MRVFCVFCLEQAQLALSAKAISIPGSNIVLFVRAFVH